MLTGKSRIFVEGEDMFTRDTFHETEVYVKSVMESKLQQNYIEMARTANFRITLYFFQMNPTTIIHLIEKEMLPEMPIISVAPDLHYIDDQTNHVNESPTYGGELENGILTNLTKTKCHSLLRLFRDEYNIPYFTVSIDASYGNAYFDYTQHGKELS